MSKKIKVIDLSVPLENYSFSQPPTIQYVDHKEGARFLSAKIGVNPEHFPGGLAVAFEFVTASTHAATHLDAPYHFGPICEGKLAKTIDQVPLEWCYGPGVVLDLTHRQAGESISVLDIQEALEKINYTLSPFDIVLIRTDADKYLYDVDYNDKHPGVSAEATVWLLDQGIKVVGIDGFGFDRPYTAMGKDFKDTGAKEILWPSHFAGREREYCHIEKLANLDQIPRPFGFTIAVFPIKISRASSGWCRAVAIIEEDAE